MKALLETVLAVATLTAASAPADALGSSKLEGRWKNGPMEIVIAPCGDSLCGRVVKASDRQKEKAERGSGTHLLGAQVIDNIRPSGPGTWSAHVFVASRNMNARGIIEEVGPDHLSVRGCIFAILCKTTHWSRIG